MIQSLSSKQAAVTYGNNRKTLYLLTQLENYLHCEIGNEQESQVGKVGRMRKPLTPKMHIKLLGDTKDVKTNTSQNQISLAKLRA